MSCIVRLLHAGREGTRCAWVVHWLSESVPSWGGKKSDFRISIVVVEVKVDHSLKRKHFRDRRKWSRVCCSDSKINISVKTGCA